MSGSRVDMSRLTKTSSRRNLACAAVIVLGALLGACDHSNQQDLRLTIEELAVEARPGSAQPNLATGPNGELVLSWQEPAGGSTALRFATLAGDSWSQPRTVATGANWFVNWADFPSVVPVADDFWAAHWLEKRPGGTYAYDIAVAVSQDAGTSWTSAITPHTDGTATEHGFVSLFPMGGKVGALWLDGRNMQPDGGHEHGGEDAMTLRSALIDHELGLSEEVLADSRVCDCCQTDVAIAGKVPVAVYRNRSEGEIRDIYIARRTRAGWTEGEPIADDGWKIAGCPVNGPAIDAIGDTVVVAWFTGAGNEPKVRFARSEDGGVSFAAPVDVSVDGPLGRVDVVALADGSAIVSYLDKAPGESANIVLRLVRADGSKSEPITAAVTAAGRMAGFPQLARQLDHLVLAWTDADDNLSRVRSARIVREEYR